MEIRCSLASSVSISGLPNHSTMSSHSILAGPSPNTITNLLTDPAKHGCHHDERNPRPLARMWRRGDGGGMMASPRISGTRRNRTLGGELAGPCRPGEHLDRAGETERTADGKGERDELGDAGRRHARA